MDMNWEEEAVGVLRAPFPKTMKSCRYDHDPEMSTVVLFTEKFVLKLLCHEVDQLQQNNNYINNNRNNKIISYILSWLV